jgi:MSHA biogenesis protein MshL
VLNTKLWLALIAVALAGCAHNTAIAPSQGHIDIENAQPGQAVPNAVIPKPVTDSVFVPPPKPRPKEQTYSVVVNEVPVKEILFALARESKLNIDIHPSIQGRVTLNAVDQTLPAILERLARQVDLTYKVDGNVLVIKPDQPVLRTYKVDYVNMSRDTKGYIGAAAEIASTGQAAATGAGGAGGGQSSSSSSASGNNANNSSRTSVTSESKNRFWETLISNIEDILAETDKEVIITRTTGDNTTETVISSDVDPDNPVAASTPMNSPSAEQSRDEARTEYKTLFAATVIANPEAGVLTIRANSKQHEKIQEYLDKVVASVKRQVLIEATIVEVRLNDTYQAGINWSRLGDGFIFSQTLGPQIATSFGPDGIVTDGGPGLVAGYTNSNFLGFVQLLQQFGDTKVLSSPKMMVLNNQTAVLKVVNNLVYFTVQAQQSQGAVSGNVLSTVTTTPNTVPVGLIMSVTPQISATGMVNINVRPTISRVLSFVNDPNPVLTVPSLIPQIQVRELESMLQVTSGNTAVLGGLMQDEIINNSDHVPGLYKLPLVGKLFTGEDKSNIKTELVIFLRPTVIDSPSLESDELESFKQFLPTPQLQDTAMPQGSMTDEPVN